MDTDEPIVYDTIITLVTKYRQLKARSDKLKAEMDDVKRLVASIVDKEGNWKDQLGYARRITKNDSVSYDGNLDHIVFAWAESDSLILKTQGKMIMSHRKMHRGSSYIQVK